MTPAYEIATGVTSDESYSQRVARTLPKLLSEGYTAATPLRAAIRRYDEALGCWVKVEPVASPAPSMRRERLVPFNDGSGVWWDVFDRMGGQRLWRVEAWDFAAAKLEKDRLCRHEGFGGGCAYLRRVRS